MRLHRGDPIITTREVEEVLDRIGSTGRKGADHTQIVRFICEVCGATGSRAGYDAPWSSAAVAAAAETVRGAARENSFSFWTTGQGSHAVERIGKRT